MKDLIIMALAGIALVLVLLVVGAQGSEPWQDGATVMLPADGRGVVVALVSTADSTIIIVDSVNTVSVYDNETYLSRKGTPYGRFGNDAWRVFVGVVGFVGKVER